MRRAGSRAGRLGAGSTGARAGAAARDAGRPRPMPRRVHPRRRARQAARTSSSALSPRRYRSVDRPALSNITGTAGAVTAARLPPQQAIVVLHVSRGALQIRSDGAVAFGAVTRSSRIAPPESARPTMSLVAQPGGQHQHPQRGHPEARAVETVEELADDAVAGPSSDGRDDAQGPSSAVTRCVTRHTPRSPTTNQHTWPSGSGLP